MLASAGRHRGGLHVARAARQRALVERPEGALPARRARPDRRAARGAVRAAAAGLAPRGQPARRHPGDRPRRLRAGRVEHRPALHRDALGRHADLPVRPPRPRDGQLAARRDRDVPAARAVPDRGGGLRPARRARPRRRGAGRRRRARGVREGAAEARSSSRACSTRPRRGPAAGASRSPTSRRRPCCTGCRRSGLDAERDPAPRRLGRGLLRSARPGPAIAARPPGV